VEFFIRLAIGCLVPSALFFVLLKGREIDRSRKGVKAPVKDPLLRPPGESLRLQVDDLFLKMGFWIVVVLGVSMATALTIKTPLKLWELSLPLLVVSFSIWRLWISWQKHSNYSLGFMGERVVAEELNKLMASGFQVFHDFPAGPKWNIDHIVIGPTGVFAIETKTRRKRKAPEGKENYKVAFDGKRLVFPNGPDENALNQAKANAQGLAVFLTKSIAEPVKVTPILTFPGWLVVLNAKPEFPILNPKSIPSWILGHRGNALDKQTMDRIAYQIEQKCRDVEF
jgi:hypothetical protein